MARLNQIIAVEKNIKSVSQAELTAHYQALQKAALLSGISRTYKPKDDENGEQLPPESTKVQLKTATVIKQVSDTLTKLFDVVAVKDWANCEARADVVINGNVLLKSVPATYLLFLEKQLVDLHTFIKKLPVLDSSETWDHDPAADCFITEPTETVKTKKIPRNHVKAEATAHHAAQVEVYHEDVIVGRWKTIKYSGALPAQRVNELLARAEALQKAVKFAREEANSTEVKDIKIGDKFFAYLFGK